MHPARFNTGHKDRTIPNPATLYYDNCHEVYEGPARGYDFRKQATNKLNLANALRQEGIHFTTVAGIVYEGDRGYNQRFVAFTDNPNIFWYKYVGFIAQSGQNHIFIYGRRIKVSYFLAMATDMKRALLQNDTDWLDKNMSKELLAHYDESGSYWN